MRRTQVYDIRSNFFKWSWPFPSIRLVHGNQQQHISPALPPRPRLRCRARTVPWPACGPSDSSAPHCWNEGLDSYSLGKDSCSLRHKRQRKRLRHKRKRYRDAKEKSRERNSKTHGRKIGITYWICLGVCSCISKSSAEVTVTLHSLTSPTIVSSEWERQSVQTQCVYACTSPTLVLITQDRQGLCPEWATLPIEGLYLWPKSPL